MTMSSMESYFANLKQTYFVHDIVLVSDAAHTSSPKPIRRKRLPDKAERPSFNESFQMDCPPPCCPARQISRDDLTMPSISKRTTLKGNSLSLRHDDPTSPLKDFFTEVAPKLSLSPQFKTEHRTRNFNSNNLSLLCTSRTSYKQGLGDVLSEVEGLLGMVEHNQYAKLHSHAAFH